MTTSYSATPIADGVWRIVDARGIGIYLLVGNERALLIDTGVVDDDLPAFGATLTSLPLTVVNTHGHRDHVAANRRFPAVHLHTLDLPLVQGEGTRSYGRPDSDDATDGEATTMTALVAIRDGHVFELGNRPVRVIATPGHSAGSIALLDQRSRILFCGDSPRGDSIWLHLPTSRGVYAYYHGLRRLLDEAGTFDTLAPAHSEPRPVGTLLEDLAACAQGIMTEELVGETTETRFGACRVATHNGATIYYREEDALPWRPGPTGEAIISPEVHADRTVIFRVLAPGACNVMLSSTPILNALGSSDDRIAFGSLDERGVWSLTVGPLPSNVYDYVFDVDGVTRIDPNHNAHQTGLAPARSLLTVPGDDGPAYFEARDVPHGALHHHRYTSRTVGDVRDVFVYTPPGYDADPNRDYPILYLHHGGGDDASAWSTVGRANLIADNLLAEGGAEPMIIAMPLGQAVPRSAPYDEWVHNTPRFEQDLFTDIMPLVESTYRVRATPEGRAMAGLSMGGSQTFQIGLSHLDLFGSIGILSSGLQGLKTRYANLLADPTGTNDALRLLLIVTGSWDHYATEGARHAHQTLAEAGIAHVYVEYEGMAHTWAVWRRALHEELLPRLWR